MCLFLREYFFNVLLINRETADEPKRHADLRKTGYQPGMALILKLWARLGCGIKDE